MAESAAQAAPDYNTVTPKDTSAGAKTRDEIAKIMNDTWWLLVCPCFCGGYGCSQVGDPYCLGSSKFCCLESNFWTEDMDSGMGLCFSLQKCCCCVNHCACPPGGGADDGVPLFACCNKRCGGGETGQNLLDEQNAHLMNNTFLLYYCVYFGFGLTSQVSDPYIKRADKCCCIRAASYSAECCPSDRDCIYEKSKNCCLTKVSVFPPCGGKTDGIPGCAICGQILMGAPATNPEQQALR